MKQVFFDKGLAGAGNMGKSEEWRKDFEFDGAKVAADAHTFLLALAAVPESTVSELAGLISASMPSSVSMLAAASLGVLRAQCDQYFSSMVAMQEELDWECLYLDGITGTSLTVPEGL